MLKVVADEAVRENLTADPDKIARKRARQMLADAFEHEVTVYIAAHAEERDQERRRLVVRNGHARLRWEQPRSTLYGWMYVGSMRPSAAEPDFAVLPIGEIFSMPKEILEKTHLGCYADHKDAVLKRLEA